MGVRAKIVLQDHLVDKAHRARPVVLRKWRRQCEIKTEIRVPRREVGEIILVEDFLPRARTVPETDFARGVFSLEQMREMRTKRSHSSAPTDINHLLLRRLQMKIAERADRRHVVACLEIKNVR